MNRQRLEKLRDTYRDGLLTNVLPFWITHAPDSEHGGFFTCVDRDGTVIDTDKNVWQQGRFTWLLAKMYNHVEPRQEWLDLAMHGAKFLTEYCFDPADGRMWFHLTCEGEPIRKRRYAFSESFAAIAFGQLFKATGDEQFQHLAIRAFKRFIEHNENPQGVQPKQTDVRPTRGLGYPMIALNTAQELRNAFNMPFAEQTIDRYIDVIRTYHMKPEQQCVMETVGPSGEIIDHFDGRTLNPGHAIECAWFIMQEGEHRQESSLIQLGCDILDWMWARGWDEQHGGLLYFVDLHGLPVQEYWHDMKFWWPHNEAIIATLMSYKLTGLGKYAAMHQQVHDWAYRYFPDLEHGEWFGYLHRDGSVSSRAKGNWWKGPFHLPRMQWMCWQMTEAMLK